MRLVISYTLSLFFSLSISLNNVSAQSDPANVRKSDGSSSLVLWLNGSNGTSTITDGAALSGWTDLSGYANDASQGSGTKQPLFYSTTFHINNYPVIRFDGDLTSSGANGDRLEIADAANLDNSSELSFFIVQRPTTLDGNPRATISKRTTSGSQEAYSQFYYTSNYLNTDIANNTRQSTNPTSFSAGTTYLTSTVYSNPDLSIYSNGTLAKSASGLSTSIPNSSADLLLGQLGGNNIGYFAGDLAEVLVYTEALNTVERILIENALASKYSLTISNDKFAFEGTHGNDIFGIGQESDGDKSSNVSDRVRIVSSSISDGTYLMWGHDGGAATLTEVVDIPTGNNARLEQEWRVDYSGSSVTTTVKISTNGLSLGAGETYRLLIDADGTFATGALQYAGTQVGDTLVVSNVTIDSDVYLTLGRATASASTTFYSYQDGDWEVANSWTTDPTGFTQIPVGGQIPGSTASATILNGRTITIPTADAIAKTLTTLTIESGATLDITNTTGHDFGVMSGEGLLKLNTVTLPTGSFAAFVSTSGGTIEYYDLSGTLPSSLTTYNNLLITNSTASDFTLTLGSDISLNGDFELSRTSTGTITFQLGNSTSVRSFTVEGDVLINDATITVSTDNATHTVIWKGDVTNTDGVIDFVNSNGEANVYFQGNSSNTLQLGGTLNQFYFIELDKGSDQTYILTVNADAGSNLTITKSSGYRINIKNGTLKLASSEIVLTNLGNGSNYDIGSSANTNGALWVDGASVTMNAAVVVYGKLIVSSGTMTVPNQGLVIREDGEIVIEGGTLTVEKYRISTAGGTHRGTLTVTGGTFNIDNSLSGSSISGYAAFSIPFSSQFLNVSGGTINVLYAEPAGTAIEGGIQINCDPDNINVTGGTWNVYIPTGTTDFRIASKAPFYNLNIYKNGTGAGKAIIQDINSAEGNVAAQTLEVLNDFTLTTTGSPVFDANGYDVKVARNFSIQTGASYTNTGATNTFYMTHEILNTVGSVQYLDLDVATTFDNFIVDTDNSLVLDGSADATISGNFSLLAGSLNDNSKTLSIEGDVVNATTHTGSGSVVLQGVALQSVSGGGTFQNLTFDNASNVQLVGNISVSGNLRLESGLLALNQYQLSLGTAANIYDAATGTGTAFSSTKMITTSGASSNAGLVKSFTSSGGSFTYPLGTGSDFTPAIINVTNAAGSAGTVAVKPVSSEHPNVSSSGTSLTYYWKITKTGFGASPSATLTFTYVDADISGTEANYVSAYFDNSDATWSFDAISDVDESTNVIGGSGTALAGITLVSGDYTAGESASFGAVTVYYSKASGDWNTASTWSTVSHVGPDAATPPTLTDFVVIGDGSSNNHDVFVTDASSASCATLKISTGSSLDLRASVGNTFSNVIEGGGSNGFGTLRLNSSTFPSGDWSLFITASAGTVEYYTDSSGDLTISSSQIEYNNLSFVNDDGSPHTITLSNADLQINGDFLIGSASNAASLIVLSDLTGTHSINVDGDFTLSSVSPANTTTFTFQDGQILDLIVTGDISVDTNSILEAESSGSTTHTIELSSDFTNAGSVDFSTGSTNVDITFKSASDATISGAGSTFDFNSVVLNKGVNSTNVLELNAANATISGDITLTNGTLKLTVSQTITLANNVAFSIPATTQLWLNGATAEITGTGSLSLVGKLLVDSGTLNVGTSNQNNVIEYSASGSPEIEINGGTITVASQIRRPTFASSGNLIFSMSNGTLIVGDQQAPTTARAVFEVLNNGTFTMSGGTIEIVRAQTSSTESTIAALYIRPSSSTITGGIIQIGGANTATSQTIYVNTTAEFYDFVVNSVNSPVAKLKTEDLIIQNDFTIEATSEFDANGLDLYIEADFLNNGTFTPSGNTTYFTGAVPTITGSTSFYNLSFSNSGTLSVSDNITISNDFTISSNGIIDIGTQNITALGDVSLIGSITASSGDLVMQGISTQTISGNGAASIDRLHIDNTTGVISSANLIISELLILNTGILNIGSTRLDLTSTSVGAIEDGSAGTTFSTSNMIQMNGSSVDLGVRKAFTTGANDFTFPVGISTGYTPARFNFSSNTSAGTITVKTNTSTIASKTDDNGDGLDLLDFYWQISESGFTTYNVTHEYTYLESDVQNEGASSSDADYVPGRFYDGSWTKDAAIGSMNSVTNVITIDGGAGGVNYLVGSYTAGADEEFGILPTYYSITDGDWEDPNSWSTISHIGVAATSTPAGNPVRISSAHTITITANSKSSVSLFVDGTLIVGSFTGHSFGDVTGTGVIELSTNIFPGGDFSVFTSELGGTISFASGSFTLSTRTTYNNISISNVGTKTLPNVDITVNGTVSLTNGVLNSSTFNRDIYLRGDWSNTASTAAFTPGTSTIYFEGTGAQAISGTFQTTFYNIAVNKTGTLTLNEDVGITKDLTLTSGSIDLNSQTINLSGDLTNNNALTAIGVSDGTFNMNGSSTQTINGTQASRFFNLTLNNSSVTGVQLSKGIEVHGTLTFTDGHLQTGSESVSLQSTGSISGEHSDHYLIGTVNTTRSLGVGASTFGNLGFSIAAGTQNLGNVTLKRVSGSAGKVVVGAKESIERRWVVTNTGANPFDARDISYSWVANEDNGKNVSVFRLYGRSTEGSGAFEGIDDYKSVSTASDTRTITVSQNHFTEISGSDPNSPLPIQLATINLTSQTDNIHVQWQTQTEFENYGFEISRKWDVENVDNPADTAWVNVGFVNGNGTSTEPHDYEFEDNSVTYAGKYLYSIRQIDYDGAYFVYGPYEVMYKAPEKIELQNAYPNPFNPETIIPYEISKTADVRIEVFNTIGQKVSTLVDKEHVAGTYKVVFNASRLSSGMYFIRMNSDGKIYLKKVMLVK